MNRTHWLGEKVSTLATNLGDLPGHLPMFDRYRFGRNRFKDVIMRRARGSSAPVPVGLVSKKYVLVQHVATILAVIREIEKAGIDPCSVRARLLITEYGTRMALRATLPASYGFTPADGHRVALTFECFNSVDGTVPLFAVVGWLRFVCSNGLVVGTVAARVKKRHLPPLAIEETSDVLAEGTESALADREVFGQWGRSRFRWPTCRSGLTTGGRGLGTSCRGSCSRHRDDRSGRQARSSMEDGQASFMDARGRQTGTGDRGSVRRRVPGGAGVVLGRVT